MTIYGISGLGADERVFQYINLGQEIQPIHWIKPKNYESLPNYAARLCSQIQDEDFILIGVSFGGIVAIEIAKIKTPKLIILISSAEKSKDLKIGFRIIGKTAIVAFVPTMFFKPPKWLMYWLFGAENKKLLGDIIDDTDLYFTKWAIQQLATWKHHEKLKNVIKIHGTAGKLIPYKKDNKTIAIENGHHFMIVDRADEIGLVIKEKIKSIG